MSVDAQFVVRRWLLTICYIMRGAYSCITLKFFDTTNIDNSYCTLLLRYVLPYATFEYGISVRECSSVFENITYTMHSSLRYSLYSKFQKF